MSAFTLYLQGTTQNETFENVVLFNGEDESGRFAILAHHIRMIAILKYSLAWFDIKNEDRQYLALPGGILYFKNNELYINTEKYYRNSDYQEMANVVDSKVKLEESNLHLFKNNLQKLELALLRQLKQIV